VPLTGEWLSTKITDQHTNSTQVKADIFEKVTRVYKCAIHMMEAFSAFVKCKWLKQYLISRWASTGRPTSVKHRLLALSSIETGVVVKQY